MRLFTLRCICSAVAIMVLLSACSENSGDKGSENNIKDAAQQTENGSHAVGQPESAEILAETEPTVSPPEILRVVTYTCNDGLEFKASYIKDALILDLNDDSVELRQQASASGALYSNDSMSFHSKGSSAIYTNDIHSFECESDESQARSEL